MLGCRREKIHKVKTADCRSMIFSFFLHVQRQPASHFPFQECSLFSAPSFPIHTTTTPLYCSLAALNLLQQMTVQYVTISGQKVTLYPPIYVQHRMPWTCEQTSRHSSRPAMRLLWAPNLSPFDCDGKSVRRYGKEHASRQGRRHGREFFICFCARSGQIRLLEWPRRRCRLTNYRKKQNKNKHHERHGCHLPATAARAPPQASVGTVLRLLWPAWLHLLFSFFSLIQ